MPLFSATLFSTWLDLKLNKYDIIGIALAIISIIFVTIPKIYDFVETGKPINLI